MPVTVEVVVQATGRRREVPEFEYQVAMPDGTVRAWWDGRGPEGQEATAGRHLERFAAFALIDEDWQRVAFVLKRSGEPARRRLGQRIERRVAQVQVGLLGEDFFRSAEEICWVREGMRECGLRLPDEGGAGTPGAGSP